MVPLENRRLRLIVALIAAFLLVLLLSPQSFAQAPTKDDTYVTGASPSTNNGSATSLVVQAGGSPSYTYIRFDLSRIPTAGAAGTITSAMVQKATLRLFVTAVTAAGPFDVFEMGGNNSTQNWAEGTITYSSQSSYTLFKPLASGIQVSYPTPNSKNQYIIVDVTQAVKDWLDCLNNGCTSGQYNNGIVLKPSSGSSISATFSSKEDTTASHDPELNIVWEPTAAQIIGQIAPSQIASGTAAINISGNAATATLANGLSNQSPQQCPSGQVASGVTNTGNAVCTTIAAANLTGTLPLANGGTGASTASGALSNLGAASSTNLNSEVSRAEGAESSLSTAISNEALARSQGDAATLSSANQYTDTAKSSVLNQNQTFAGNDTFSGNNSFTGSVTLSSPVINQASNGSDTVFGKRATDSSPTGSLMHFENAAGSN